jgi:hypothetical protein
MPTQFPQIWDVFEKQVNMTACRISRRRDRQTFELRVVYLSFRNNGSGVIEAVNGKMF